MILNIANASNVSMGDSVFSGNIEFGDFILLTISLFVLASGLLSIVFILWGGLLLILSGGKDDKIKPAINTIRYSVIGVIVTVLTIFLFPVFGRLLGLDVEKYAKPQRIFEKIESIGNKIFGKKGTGVTVGTTGGGNLESLPDDFSNL